MSVLAIKEKKNAFSREFRYNIVSCNLNFLGVKRDGKYRRFAIYEKESPAGRG